MCRIRRLFFAIFMVVLLTIATFAVRQMTKPQDILLIESQPVSRQHSAADTDQNGWQLLLVNAQNPLPDGFSVELADLPHGHAVDARIASDLQAMLDACRAAGLSPLICSSYRTEETQQSLFDNKVQRLIDEGYTLDTAQVKASTVVAVPGTSEHQTGLALDLVDESNQNLDETQETTPVQKWLMVHSWEYGFVLRYPNGKSEITGIIYEPWHYRYVGREAAGAMHESGLCLEEYLQQLQNDNACA